MKMHLAYHHLVGVGDVEIYYTISPFVPATYWQPAEGGEVEIESVVIDGADITDTLSVDQMDKLMIVASEDDRDDGPDPDEMRDRRKDDYD